MICFLKKNTLLIIFIVFSLGCNSIASEGSLNYYASCEKSTTLAIYGYSNTQICLLEKRPDVITVSENMSVMKIWKEDDITLMTGNIEFAEDNLEIELRKFLEINKQNPKKIAELLFIEFVERFRNQESKTVTFNPETNHLHIFGEAENKGYFIEAVVMFNTFERSIFLVQFVYKGLENRYFISSRLG